jgi:hypothetical protein
MTDFGRRLSLPDYLFEWQEKIENYARKCGLDFFPQVFETLREIGVETLCTNRDLPLTMPLGLGKTDFLLESAAPVNAIRCRASPSRQSNAPGLRARDGTRNSAVHSISSPYRTSADREFTNTRPEAGCHWPPVCSAVSSRVNRRRCS